MSHPVNLSREQVERMAHELQSGFTIYLNTDTGEYQALSDPEQWTLQGEFRTDAHRRITDHWDHYIIITCMESWEIFEIMEEFLFQVDEKFHYQLLDAMYRQNPLENFQYLVESSKYRDQWLEFSKMKHREYICDHIRSAGLSSDCDPA